MIFSQNLIQKYPFAVKFLESALTNSKKALANGFILEGNNIISQYQMVLEIAKYLNCKQPKIIDAPCLCNDCNWIKENAHPAIITISPIDYTSKDRKEISVDQIRELRSALGVTSPYHRIIIFTDAKKTASDLPFAYPKFPSSEVRDWSPYPLTERVFDKSPTNAMLKILEEPPQNVTFFFLTSNKEELLPTIVSRCQSLCLFSKEKDDKDYSLINDFVNKIPYQDENEVIEAVQKFLELSKDTLPESLIDMMQQKIKNSMEENLSDKLFVMQQINILNSLEDTKKELQSFVQLQNSVEKLFFTFLR